MPSLSKIQSGFMYEESFDNNGIVWQTFPQTDKFIANGDSFKIEAGTERIMLLTSIPDDNFVMQVKIQHQPLSYNNFAGVVVVRDKDSWVECRSYRDEITETSLLKTYQYIKIVKKIDNFMFYASIQGNQWEFIGASRVYDANMIGFFLESDEPSSYLLIEEIKMYRSPVISFLGIEPLSKLIIKRPTGTNRYFSVIDNPNRVDIDLVEDLFPYKDHTIQILAPDGTTIVNDAIASISGGDVYDISYNLEMRLNETIDDPGILISPGETIDLGRLTGFQLTNTLTLRNLDPQYTAYNKKLKIEKFNDYNRGYDFVKIALEEQEGVPGEFGKEISIPELLPNVPVKIHMRITKDMDPVFVFTEAKHKYRVIIE